MNQDQVVSLDKISRGLPALRDFGCWPLGGEPANKVDSQPTAHSRGGHDYRAAHRNAVWFRRNYRHLYPHAEARYQRQVAKGLTT